MLDNQPRIAVLIPAHNAEKTLGATLASLAANTIPHDILIVDDASNTLVREAVKLPANAHVLRFDSNRGVTIAANHGLRYLLQRGYEYIARLDADDTAMPDRLALQLAYMDANPDVAILGGAGHVVTETGHTIFYLNHPTDFHDIKRALYYNSCFLQPTFMMRAKALKKYGLYDETFPNAEDYEMLRRYARYTKIANLPQYLINYTVSFGGLSVSKRQQQLRLRLRVQWRYRNFFNIHFYLGILKTLILCWMPMEFIASIKKRLDAYQHKN